MNGWMDGLMNGGWIDEGIDRLMDGWIDEWWMD